VRVCSCVCVCVCVCAWVCVCVGVGVGVGAKLLTCVPVYDPDSDAPPPARALSLRSWPPPLLSPSPPASLPHSSDPYVVLTLGDQRHKSSTVEKNLNPTWNEG
jgi:hypothetical protein